MILPAAAHLSLMHGWLPTTVQSSAALMLLLAIGWRTRRWRRIGLPVAALLGAAAAAGAYRYLAGTGRTDDSAPAVLWVWVALAGAAAAVLLLGWRTAARWRRTVSALALPLCLLSTGSTLNGWVGYFPTVQSAWTQLTAGPLPGQSDLATVTGLAGRGAPPHEGRVLPVTIPAGAAPARHRGELVYLPPAWFAQSPPPALPVVMMIGGQFNTPADWLRDGGAAATVDAFAAAHGGNAPVLVFVDSGGSLNNGAECVNGPHGTAVDHLADDVIPYLVTHFGVSGDPAHWAVAGWSTGGTCAVALVAAHPEKFSTFVDIAGDTSPHPSSRAQTIARLFGGSPTPWAAFDPATVIARHGRYAGTSGWVAVDEDAAGGGGRRVAAESLCRLGRANGIDCAVIVEPGRHDWPFAEQAFAGALPWLAWRLNTPGVQPVGFRSR